MEEPFPHYLSQGMVTKDGAAMSKSKGNVVDPDDMIDKYGADSVRLFILFAAPPEKEFAWDDKGIEGCFRFLNRIWVFFQQNLELFHAVEKSQDIEDHSSKEIHDIQIKMNQTIKKVTEDIRDRYHLNTAISSIMEFFNELKKSVSLLKSDGTGRKVLTDSMIAILKLMAPFAPHISEELWRITGQKSSLMLCSWPEHDPGLVKEDTVTIVVQVNGKLRAKFDVERNTSEEKIKDQALSLENIDRYIQGKKPRKIIYIKNKLVNIVV
jgi:leucyl-tRNA synthetase